MLIVLDDPNQPLRGFCNNKCSKCLLRFACFANDFTFQISIDVTVLGGEKRSVDINGFVIHSKTQFIELTTLLGA